MNFRQSNWLIDVVMPQVSPNAFKVIAYVARQTWGWERERWQISVSDFQEGMGTPSRGTASRAIDEALDSGFIARAKDGNSFTYWPVAKNVPEMRTVQKEERTGNGYDIVPETGTGNVPEMGTPPSYIKKEKEKADHDPVTAYRRFEQISGVTLTPGIADEITDALDEFGEEEVLGALDAAEEYHPRSWAYIDRILRQGQRSPPPSNGNNGHNLQATSIWERYILPYHNGSANFRDLPADAQQTIRAIGGDGVKRMATDSLRIKYYQHMKGVAA